MSSKENDYSLHHPNINTNEMRTASAAAAAAAAAANQCKVCGDKGIGFNFGVQTCESCKAFFRRNALLNKEFKCPFENRCEITVKTRKYCQKCRLNKCNLVGMRKELIQTDGASKRKTTPSSSSSCTSPSSSSSSAKPFEVDSPDSSSGRSEEASNEQSYLREIDCFNDYLDEYYNSDVESIIGRIDASNFEFPAENLLNFVCNKSVQYEFMFMDRFIYHRGIDEVSSSQIDFEKDYALRLEELRQACSILLPKYFDVEHQIVNIIAAIQASEINIINLIKMTKMLSAFKRLPIDEQIGLLKTNIKEITTIYNVILYNGQHDSLTFYNQVINFNTINQICSPHISAVCRRNIIQFQELIKEDINIFNLLLAIILFKPRLESSIDKEYIRNQYLIYVHMLKHYLHQKLNNKCQAETMFIRILVKLEEMYVLSSVIYKCFYNIDKNQLATFCKEIFEGGNL